MLQDVENKPYVIRQFNAGEVEQYKAMRLEALQLEPGMFGSSYASEINFSAEKWLDRLVSINSACFGLYYDDDLIGITGIVVDWDDNTRGLMVQSYIRKAHRGRGLANLLYEARIAWAQKHGLQSLRIGHRASNLTSKAANQRYSFQFVYREPCIWPDGSTEDTLYYDLKLQHH